MPHLLLTALLSMSPAAEASRPGAAPRPPEVQVPFGCGLGFVVSQAHATGSHLQNDTHAWDFRMPDGTPIVAAQDGVVRLARGDSTRGGCSPRFAADANYVVVEHAEGLETQYLHFSAVTVRVGDKVKAGDLLGFSGRTGWACGAHLHFKVARRVGRGWNNPSVSARIAGYGDPQAHTLIHAPACLPKSQVQFAATESEGDTSAAKARGGESPSLAVRDPAGPVLQSAPSPHALPPPVLDAASTLLEERGAPARTAAGGGGKVK